MSEKTESIMAILAALLVLFTAIADPRISVGLAVILLVGFAIYKSIKR